ncbi:MAG: DUF222 domain-containing protein [Acidimicrobiales bacterium]
MAGVRDGEGHIGSGSNDNAGGGVRDGGGVAMLRDRVPGSVFELPGCRERGARREGGRFCAIPVEERAARIEELVAESQALVGRINADQAALCANTTELLGLFQADQGWGWGWRSPAHRLACQLKLTGAEARRLVATADVLPDLPELSAAFEHGEVSMPIAAALAEIATPETEATLVEQARYGTADTIVKMVSTYKRLEAEDGDRPARKESLSLQARADGYEVRWFLPSLSGASLEKMLQQRRSEMRAETGQSASNADALWSLLDAGPRPAAERFLAVIQIDLEVFRAHRERRLAGIEDDGTTGVSVLHGPPVSDDELEAMHGELSTCWLVSRDGHPLWISSRQRSAPPWMRTAMAVEQPCCAAEGCGRSGVLEAHHSVPFTTKPETLFDEQVFLCPFHHRALHAAGASVEFGADRKQIVIRDHRGRVMTLTGVPTPPDVSPCERPPWQGRGIWAGGMETYDHFGLDVIIGYLQSRTERWIDEVGQPRRPAPPPEQAGSHHRHPPPANGAGHPADPQTTGGDNGSTSPPNA